MSAKIDRICCEFVGIKAIEGHDRRPDFYPPVSTTGDGMNLLMDKIRDAGEWCSVGICGYGKYAGSVAFKGRIGKAEHSSAPMALALAIVKLSEVPK